MGLHGIRIQCYQLNIAKMYKSILIMGILYLLNFIFLSQGSV